MEYPLCGSSIFGTGRKDGCVSVEKIVILVERGMVTAVYGSMPPGHTDVEVLDMDTTDPDELAFLDERLAVVQQHLTKQY